MTDDMETRGEYETRMERLAAEQSDAHWIRSPRVRRWIYSIITVVVPLLVTLDVVSGEIGGHILSIAAAVLAMGATSLAGVNTR